MRPLGILGILLIIAGVVVLAMRGISYTKERQSVSVGPLEVAAERKGFIPPAVGIAAVVVGAGLLLASRRRA
ncbi:MAG TPA: hypothetical protein VFS05_17005 [Gemmatimonadaceae bacterium]|nr:hypothetical protein [Gemmatimonadaceae bacterium]